MTRVVQIQPNPTQIFFALQGSTSASRKYDDVAFLLFFSVNCPNILHGFRFVTSPPPNPCRANNSLVLRDGGSWRFAFYASLHKRDSRPNMLETGSSGVILTPF